jgi:putative Mn2+ efflux pump MntP
MDLLFVLNSAALGVGLAMDAFSVSLANGLHEPGMRRSRMCKMAGVYAFFQYMMPMIGWVCVHTIVEMFSAFEKAIPWIALILLVYIGGKMLKEGIEERNVPEGELAPHRASKKDVLVQGVATSIDALSVGFAIAEYGFIEANTDKKILPGNFVNTKGEVLGTHKGITHYTVGQRKGLGLSMGRPVFVVEIRPETNEVVIGDNDEVFQKELVADRVNMMSREDFDDGMEVMAKIRYNHKGALCRIYHEGEDKLRCVFNEPQRAVTPGQAVVLYEGDFVLGGGTILC